MRAALFANNGSINQIGVGFGPDPEKLPQLVADAISQVAEGVDRTVTATPGQPCAELFDVSPPLSTENAQEIGAALMELGAASTDDKVGSAFLVEDAPRPPRIGVDDLVASFERPEATLLGSAAVISVYGGGTK